ncbi:MAG: sodium:alanine symporter family protein, partial [Clostridia bacterium]|nr:sodium:alanine symporter family protein [Clostridia bacterium]
MALFGKYILGGIIPIMLIGLGIFFLIYLKFFFLVKPIKTFSVLFKKEKVRGISSFSALTVALAGTLGVGNI